MSGIVTPEAVQLDLPTAHIGSRGVAFVVDLVLLGIAEVVLVLGLSVLQSAAGPVPTWVGVSVLIVTTLLVWMGYPIAFETLWRGRTPGKALLGLRVVTREGGPVRFRHAAIRAFLGLVDFYLTSGGAAILTALVSRDGQRLGDLAAGTLVLRERTGHGTPQAVTFRPPAGLEDYVARLDVSALGPREYGLVRSYLRRAGQLPAATRVQLAERLAGQAAPAVRDPVQERPSDPETYLRCVAAAYQARHRGVQGGDGSS
ncbi:MAG: RDD family protein [Actinobacteria bacterium]|nr:RDD family protein [Actinomycetota bacterium]